MIESNEYFEQYKMKEQGTRSVNAWSDFYDTEDLLDVYLEKQGYPTNHDIKKEKSAAWFQVFLLQEPMTIADGRKNPYRIFP